MNSFLVLVVLACLALDLGDAETTEKKDKEANKTTGGGGDSIVSDLLGSPEMIQSVMPKNMDEIFDMLEKFVPGMKQLQPLLEKTWKLMDPVMKVFSLQNKKEHHIIAQHSKEWPAVSQKMLPTLMEIFKSLQKDEKVTDEQYAKWGKALIKDNRKFFK